MCGCILENAQLKSRRERKSIQTKRLTVQPIFLPSTSPIFMQSLKQKVMKFKRNDIYPLTVKHTSENRRIWLGKLIEMMQPKGIWVNSRPRCVKDFTSPFLGHRTSQSSRKSMFFSGSVTDLLGDCWRSFGFFIPCAEIMPAEASMAARRGSPTPLLLSGTHSQSCTAACTNLRKGYRLGSIFCWVSFSPCQSDHHSAAQTLVLAQRRGWCEWGNEQGWVCFLQRQCTSKVVMELQH